MLFIFHGEDTYRSRQRLHEAINEAQNSCTGEIFWCDAGERSWSEYMHIFTTPSLFFEKLIIVGERFLSSDAVFSPAREVLKKQCVDPHTLVFLWEGSIHAQEHERLKELIASGAKEESFLFLKGQKLTSWIACEIRERGVIMNEERHFILQNLGSDLWAIINTLEKMALSDLSFQETTPRPPRIFVLGEELWYRATSPTLYRLLLTGEEPMGMHTYLVGFVRSLLMVAAARTANISVPNSWGLHPFVIKKAQAMLTHVPPGQIARAYMNLLRAEISTKTGISDPEEALLLFWLRTWTTQKSAKTVSQSAI
ncbi:MAG: DNA polymerase III, delta subunit [Parcubacteria group bacterium Gr01-1014_66]|nr:MAG: DNA polymerase III, delta subunit [Parcubacteria group bacterium Gr01-1014_66]